MTREEQEALVRSLSRTCRGPLNADAAKARDALLAEGRMEEAAQADKAGRGGCGYDVNEIVCAVEFDGQPRSATCPKCGVLINFTPPHFDPDPE